MTSPAGRSVDHSTTTVDDAAKVARWQAEADGDDHGNACRCSDCLEDRR